MKKISIPNFNIKLIILLGVLVFTLIFSLCFHSIKYKGSYKTFFFEKIDTKGLFVEKRLVAKNKQKDKISCFIDELLLGPMTQRYRPVFPSGTKLLSCFERNGTLFVNLSEDILKSDSSASDYSSAVKIFKKNVFKNYRNIDIIQIYIAGKSAYEEKF